MTPQVPATTVSTQPVQTTAQPGTTQTPSTQIAQPTQAQPDPAAALQAKIDALTAQVNEQQRVAEFWHGKATERPAAPARDKPAEEEPEEDVLELATKGGKAFEKYLTSWAKKNGYVKGDVMEQAITAKATQLTREANLMKRYPDLEDKESEIFKATAKHYGNLKNQGVQEGLAMEMAAERAELELLRAGKIKTPAEEKATREQDRLARIAAQGGDRGNRGTQQDENDDELNAEQKRIAINMLAGEPGDDGKPMTPEQAIEKYKARAKKGVQRFGKAA